MRDSRKRVIGVVGLPASGKGEFSKIALELGISVVVMGDVVRKAVRDAGFLVTDHNMGNMSRQLREGLGRDALAQLTIPLIKEQKTTFVMVDGIRSDAEVDTLRFAFKGFILMAIISSFPVRMKRMQNRGRSDDLSAEDELHRRDEREIGWGLLDAIDMADFTITNEGNMTEFREKVLAFFKEAGALI